MHKILTDILVFSSTNCTDKICRILPCFDLFCQNTLLMKIYNIIFCICLLYAFYNKNIKLKIYIPKKCFFKNDKI